MSTPEIVLFVTLSSPRHTSVAQHKRATDLPNRFRVINSNFHFVLVAVIRFALRGTARIGFTAVMMRSVTFPYSGAMATLAIVVSECLALLGHSTLFRGSQLFSLNSHRCLSLSVVRLCCVSNWSRRNLGVAMSSRGRDFPILPAAAHQVFPYRSQRSIE